MKANRSFRQRDDQAVSPVIAVILMVAITVVLAATVYVWVSGFGSNSSSPAKSISFSKTKDGSTGVLTIASATPGMRWSDIRINLADTTATFQIMTSAGESEGTLATLTPTSSTAIQAGDTIYFSATSTTAISGAKVVILDPTANSVISQLAGLNTDGIGTVPSSTSFTCTRMSGTSGTWAAGNVLRVEFPDEYSFATVALTTITADWTVTTGTAPTLGTGATAALKTPKIVEITLGTAPSLNSGGQTVLSLAAAGAIKWADGSTNFAGGINCNVPA